MIIVDVNVLVFAFRPGAALHAVAQSWLMGALAGSETVGLPDESLMGFVRIVTNHRIVDPPDPPEDALEFCDVLLAHPAVTRIGPGARHWQLFRGLVLGHRLRAKDVPDAHLAALCLERGATLATFDRGFARFQGLRIVRPSI